MKRQGLETGGNRVILGVADLWTAAVACRGCLVVLISRSGEFALQLIQRLRLIDDPVLEFLC